MQDVLIFQRHLEVKYPVTITLSEDDNRVRIDAIIVQNSRRCEGIGTKVVREVMEYAKGKNKVVTLTPAGDFGGSPRRLKRWYTSLGFRPNTGRNKDFTFREAMLWRPEWPT